MAQRKRSTLEMSVPDGAEHKTATLRDKHRLHSDEPAWLPSGLAGDDAYPAPVDYLVMSLATCQVSVLKQCLERNGVETYTIECDAILDGFDRDEDHPPAMPDHTALRIDHITVTMTLHTTPEYEETASTCLARYDDGCGTEPRRRDRLHTPHSPRSPRGPVSNGSRPFGRTLSRAPTPDLSPGPVQPPRGSGHKSKQSGFGHLLASGGTGPTSSKRQNDCSSSLLAAPGPHSPLAQPARPEKRRYPDSHRNCTQNRARQPTGECQDDVNQFTMVELTRGRRSLSLTAA